MNLLLLFVEVVLLVGISAICSGLNVAVMSLSIKDLNRKIQAGNRSARLVLPLRKNIHLTLASILLTNVAAVSISSLVLDGAFNGLVAVIISTLLFVVFGEMFPQALFTRDSLAFTARFVPLLRFMIFFTYPVSKPLQILLDKLFEKRGSTLETRHELGVIIKEHAELEGSELDDDEIEIMKGALSLSEKRVRDIMTNFGDVYYMLPEVVIDTGKIDEIKSHGHSRIPVFNRKRTKCFGLILLKELVDHDFNGSGTKVSDLHLHQVENIGSMTALDTLLRKFISLHTHLLPVERDGKIVGIVTIEDLFEEIIGQEIEDESDKRKSLASNS